MFLIIGKIHQNRNLRKSNLFETLRTCYTCTFMEGVTPDFKHTPGIFCHYKILSPVYAGEADISPARGSVQTKNRFSVDGH